VNNKDKPLLLPTEVKVVEWITMITDTYVARR